MTPNPHFARHTLDSIRDALVSGAKLTPQMQRRSVAALRQIRDADGPAAARDAAARLQCVALSRAAALLTRKSARRTGPAHGASRGVNAHELRAVHQGWLASMQSRGMTS
jgi:hypothetical protein